MYVPGLALRLPTQSPRCVFIIRLEGCGPRSPASHCGLPRSYFTGQLLVPGPHPYLWLIEERAFKTT